MQRCHVLGEGALIAPEYLAALGFHGEQLIPRRGHEHHAVVHNRRRLVTFHLPGGETPNGLQPAHVLAVDLIERTVTPAVERAAEHQPVAVFRLFESLGGDRRVRPQDFRHGSRHWRRRGGRDGLLRRCSGHAGRSEDSAHTRAAHESLGIGHDVSSLSQNAPIEGFSDLSACDCLLRFLSRRAVAQVGTMPTRLVNGFATASLPSTILSGSAGKARGAGPSITAAPSRGS